MAAPMVYFEVLQGLVDLVVFNEHLHSREPTRTLSLLYHVMVNCV